MSHLEKLQAARRWMREQGITAQRVRATAMEPQDRSATVSALPATKRTLLQQWRDSVRWVW